MVGWFSSEEWRRICFLDTETPIKERILELSLSDDPRKRINEFLSQFSIKLREDEHGGEAIIEDIMNRLIDDQATAAA